MRFGLFASPQADGPPGASGASAAPGQGFHDFIDMCVEAEALGYCSVFMVEHHFSGWNQVSQPLALLTYLAAHTRTLRLGTAVMVLPWHNPVLLAEQAATSTSCPAAGSISCRQRLPPQRVQGFCHSDRRGRRALRGSARHHGQGLTTRERFSHRGKFFQFDDVIVEPPPRSSRTRPCGWRPAAHRRCTAAGGGHNRILDQCGSIGQTGGRLALYRRELEARGRKFEPMGVTVARDMFVAYNATEKDAAIARNKQFHQRILNVARAPDRAGGSHILAYSHSDEQEQTSPLIGTPDEICAKLEGLRDVGVRYVILGGGSRESLKRFARDIMPAFADDRVTETAES